MWFRDQGAFFLAQLLQYLMLVMLHEYCSLNTMDSDFVVIFLCEFEVTLTSALFKLLLLFSFDPEKDRCADKNSKYYIVNRFALLLW